ncbi:MAG: hypothetical protein JWO09_2627 [Bacteroidetes bacterium]|nr:hypothetical protein [Bacteroidota bacterium]
MKHTNLLFSGLLLFGATAMKAQMVNGNAYIKGTGVEIGIDSLGGFEGCGTGVSPVPAGMHFRSDNPWFGFVANPQNNAWASFDGDFFTPGSPENGWGFEIGTAGASGANNCADFGTVGATGRIVNWQHTGTTYSVDWEGDAITGTNLHFRINYLLQETDLFYITTVTVVNNTTATIPDLYYYRNLDPDNNEPISFDFTTQNTIVSQHVAGGTAVAEVTATQAAPWFSSFTFVAADTNFVAGYGGFTNRDGSDMYNGASSFTQTTGSVNYADEAIYLAYLVQNLAPGDSATFKFCSVFDSSAVDCAISALGVSLTTPNMVYLNAPAFALTGGTPAGGTYSGPGVTGNMFDPSAAGAGVTDVIYTYTDSVAGCTGSTSSSIHVDVAAGISSTAAANTVSVYPNPFSNEATVSFSKDVKLSNAEFHVYDLVGKEVIRKMDIRTNSIRIEQGELTPGVYFYRFINDGKEAGSGKMLVK